MNIQSVNQQAVNFSSASDISLKYILDKHSGYLPERMKKAMSEALKDSAENIPAFYKLHEKVYKPLMEAQTLNEAKALYPEFSDVLELSDFASSRSKAVKAVKNKGIPLENFTLEFLKKIFTPTTQNDLVKEYGFTNRSLVSWLQQKLKIQKLPNVYLNLINMSNEEENCRIADISRKAMYARPKEMMDEIQAKIARHHRTQEYREKKRQEMIDFYKREHAHAQKLSKIGHLTWEKCPEIKLAMSEYTKNSSDYIKKILSKCQKHQKLSQNEKHYLKGYYKGFWDLHPDFAEKYTEMRKIAIQEYNQMYS